MATTSAISMSLPLTSAPQKKIPSCEALFRPLPDMQRSRTSVAPNANGRKLQVKASSMKEKVVTGMTAAALSASIVIPDVAEAAEVSPSLKNFLLSIVAGGVVLTAIIGAIIGVSNFDPVKRG